jgi:hypothetical protein
VKLRRLLALCWGLTHGPHRTAKAAAAQTAEQGPARVFPRKH